MKVEFSQEVRAANLTLIKRLHLSAGAEYIVDSAIHWSDDDKANILKAVDSRLLSAAGQDVFSEIIPKMRVIQREMREMIMRSPMMLPEDYDRARALLSLMSQTLGLMVTGEALLQPTKEFLGGR
jgi:hypothetical protein